MYSLSGDSFWWNCPEFKDKMIYLSKQEYIITLNIVAKFFGNLVIDFHFPHRIKVCVKENLLFLAFVIGNII